jgi:3,4-dihydroxy 2-butanone 4-phosphate synthase/GTP cyclohydrolase II
MPDRLRNALSLIKSEGKGVFVYLQPDMSINKSPLNLASSLPKRTDNPKAVSSADEPGLRDYGIGAQILADLGLNKIKIITNDERRIIALEGYGLELTGRMFVDTETSVPVKRDGVELKSSLLDRQQFNVEK